MIQTLKGTGVALVTPFLEDLTVDWNGLERLLQHTSAEVDYFVIHGTTGEPATTNSTEKEKIVSFIKKHNEKNLPLVYGLGGNNTAEIVQQLQTLDFEGITAILSVSPYYNKPSQEGILRHYTAIADNSPLPVILYNVPGRTSSNILPKTTLKLAEHPNIIGIKEASGIFEQCLEISRDKPEDFLLISGDDLFTLPLLSIGAVGVISVLANAIPGVFREMITAADRGDLNAAKAAAYKILALNPLMYQESNPVGVKCLLSELEICGPWVRLPLIEASDSLADAISATIKKEHQL